MKLSLSIHKISSVLLIVLFAFSITPVIVLHNLTANHSDISYASKKEKGDQYAKTGINCNCINFVAEAPFINTFYPINFSTPEWIPVYNNYYTENFYSLHHFFAELRGPPSMA